jgi:DNA polymerase-1
MQFRKRQKLLGTYVLPARPKPLGRVDPDGRMRSDWNAHGTRVGRFSGNHPNPQNIPLRLRNMICAPPGRTLVHADEDGIHLRIIGSRWKIPSLLDAFAKGLDSHGLFAEVIFGDLYRNAPGYTGHGKKPKGGEAARMRELAKRLRYAGAYGATPPTIHRVLLSAEDENGKLINPKLKLAQTYAMHSAWMEKEPEWEAAWKREIAEWKRLGYQLSPLFGRRCEYLDGNENDVINGPILTMEGDLMSLITIEFNAALKQQFPGALLINQCHDSLTAECAEADGEKVAALMEHTMTRTLPGWEVPFIAKAKIMKVWGSE